MAGRFSDYQVNKWLDDFNKVWVAAHFDNPDVAGAYASEVFGGSYARLQVVMDQSTNRVVYNTADFSIKGLPAVTVTHLAGWDVQINGNLLFSVELPAPMRIAAGKSLDVKKQTIALSFS
jgi:hypothetical protein